MDKTIFDLGENCLAVQSMLGREELLAQTAEECAELAKAALKLRRVIDGRNPTPVTMEEALDNLEEETADVLGCMMLLEPDWAKLESRIRFKMKRWRSRLEKGVAQ